METFTMMDLDIKKENGISENRKEQIEPDEFKIPNEAACSAEFQQGCIFSE